jgi:Phytanoyl-CoA dioxygenase (PhyH)
MHQTSPNVAPKSRLLIRSIRSEPHLYSVICKTRLFHSRYILASSERAMYRRERPLFSMSSLEAKHSQELANQGFTVLPEFFGADLMDGIFESADRLFKNLHLDLSDAYSVQHGKRESLEGLTYDELAATEKMISLKDPLVAVPETVDIAFNESIIKIVTNFLGYVPPRFKPMLVRDFPGERPRESSNFHRDNDESDTVQFFVYLVDIDDTRGPLIYVPRTNHYDVQSCRPRLSKDLGTGGADGRYTDDEIEKYYPRDQWVAITVRRGSVAIIHGNGFHKGPAWPRYGDPSNKPRTALRFDLAGRKARAAYRGQQGKIRRVDYERLGKLQRLITRELGVVE